MLGPVITDEELRADALACLQTWMPSILAELARRKGLSFGPGLDVDVRFPATWGALPNLLAATQDQFPVVIVGNDGTSEITRDADGIYMATWRMPIYVAARGQGFEDTRRHLALQTAAVRVAMLQHFNLETSYVRRVRWTDEGYAELDQDDFRTLGGGAVVFDCTAADVLDEYAGPQEPPPAPDYVDPLAIDVGVAQVTIEREN